MSDANIQELRFKDFAESGYWGQQIPRPKKKYWTKKMWIDLITECEKITGENLQYISPHWAYFHTDAAYSFLQIPVDVKKYGIDLMSISSDKIHGPKGVGPIYVSEDVTIEKITDGGFQEFNLRGGTENVSGIAGFGKACEIFSEEDVERIKYLRNDLYEQFKSGLKGVQLNGSSDFSRRIPNNLNLSFDYIEGESVVLHLDMRGISVITGSACFSRALQASHILLAMGFSHERAHGSIRFSPSKYTLKEDIDYTVHHVKEVVTKLRKLSPLVEQQ